MATSAMAGWIHQLQATVRLRDAAEWTDAQLLEEYVGRRDPAALTILVQRHGPMVWGVCCRILANEPDAEDAFQATFLVLVRRAAAVRPRRMVANWLYGVARQTALKARATIITRKGRERQVVDMPEPAAAKPAPWEELSPVLDDELSRLPDRYRAALVLCDLEGRTRKAAARQLGVPEGTVAGWIARARIMLARRLTRRGFTVSGGALAAVLSPNAASAVPARVVSKTIHVAGGCGGGLAATVEVPAHIAALAKGVIQAMRFAKIKASLVIVLFAGFLTASVALLDSRHAAGQHDRQPPAAHPMQPPAKPQKDKEKETVIAWGKEAGGLQAGIALPPGAPRTYQIGEVITLIVRVRNVGTKAVKFQYLRQFLDEEPPAVTYDDGKETSQPRHAMLGFHVPVDVVLEPGKEIVLESRLAGGAKQAGAPGVRFELRPDSGQGMPATKQRPLFVRTGKIALQYQRVIGDSSVGHINIDPALAQLATGKLEIEVKPAAPAAPAARLKELSGQWQVLRADATAGETLVPAELLGLTEKGTEVTIEGNRLTSGGKVLATLTTDFSATGLTLDKTVWPGRYPVLLTLPSGKGLLCAYARSANGLAFYYPHTMPRTAAGTCLYLGQRTGN